VKKQEATAKIKIKTQNYSEKQAAKKQLLCDPGHDSSFKYVNEKREGEGRREGGFPSSKFHVWKIPLLTEK
jgi:hypothetical protein